MNTETGKRAGFTGRLSMILALEIMERPGAHVSVIEFLDEKRDGFDGIRVEVVDAPLITRGKRAGRPNYRMATNEQTRLISRVALESAADRWVERTGLCYACVGDGRQFMRWAVDEGTTYRPCPECNGTGTADGITISAARQTEMFVAAEAVGVSG